MTCDILRGTHFSFEGPYRLKYFTSIKSSGLKLTILIYIIVAQKHHMSATYPCSMKKSAQPTTSSLKLSGREEGPRVDSS